MRQTWADQPSERRAHAGHPRCHPDRAPGRPTRRAFGAVSPLAQLPATSACSAERAHHAERAPHAARAERVLCHRPATRAVPRWSALGSACVPPAEGQTLYLGQTLYFGLSLGPACAARRGAPARFLAPIASVLTTRAPWGAPHRPGAARGALGARETPQAHLSLRVRSGTPLRPAPPLARPPRDPNRSHVRLHCGVVGPAGQLGGGGPRGVAGDEAALRALGGLALARVQHGPRGGGRRAAEARHGAARDGGHAPSLLAPRAPGGCACCAARTLRHQQPQSASSLIAVIGSDLGAGIDTPRAAPGPTAARPGP